MNTPSDPILRWFAYGHLPPHLQDVSEPYCRMAEALVAKLERTAERTVALRKLLESKDAAVRAAIETQSIREALEQPGFIRPRGNT